jgi:hypothetical protein
VHRYQAGGTVLLSCSVNVARVDVCHVIRLPFIGLVLCVARAAARVGAAVPALHSVVGWCSRSSQVMAVHAWLGWHVRVVRFAANVGMKGESQNEDAACFMFGGASQHCSDGGTWYAGQQRRACVAVPQG